MSNDKRITASDVIANGAKTAQLIKGATKLGKNVAAAAKGASAGGVYGAAASLLWENRRFVAKVLAAFAFVLMIPILFIAMLPSLIFGDISAKEESDALNNNIVIMENKGTQIPRGTLAKGDLRNKRIKAHKVLELLWKKNIMSKKEAYRWVEYFMGLEKDEGHIGFFSDYRCDLLMDKVKELLNNNHIDIPVNT